jgi:SAM-dependent methyltransferase
MITMSRIRKVFRLLNCKMLGRPLDPDLQRSIRAWRLRMRVWRSVITGRPLDVQLHHEFNLWAALGAGEGMDKPHRRIIELAIPRMGLAHADRILDLACGAGLASRLMLNSQAGCERVVGMDISDGMLCHARSQSTQFKNLAFVCGSAEHLPFPENYFTKILSVEAFYYFQHQDRVLAELQRILAPEGRLFLLICLYTDHTDSLRTVDEVDVPVHVRSIDEYKTMLADGGWIDVRAEEFVRAPQPGRKQDVHDRALLLSAQKPIPSVNTAFPKREASCMGSRHESLA